LTLFTGRRVDKDKDKDRKLCGDDHHDDDD